MTRLALHIIYGQRTGIASSIFSGIWTVGIRHGWWFAPALTRNRRIGADRPSMPFSEVIPSEDSGLQTFLRNASFLSVAVSWAECWARKIYIGAVEQDVRATIVARIYQLQPAVISSRTKEGKI